MGTNLDFPSTLDLYGDARKPNFSKKAMPLTVSLSSSDNSSMPKIAIMSLVGFILDFAETDIEGRQTCRDL